MEAAENTVRVKATMFDIDAIEYGVVVVQSGGW